MKSTLSNFEKQSTLDNRNTFSQIEYLADTYVLTNEDKYRFAVEKGLDYLLRTQKQMEVGEAGMLMLLHLMTM